MIPQELTSARLMELLIDKLLLGLTAGIVLALFGYWLNRRLKNRDREYERTRSATDIRVAAANNALERVLSAGDEILAALGTLSGDIHILKQAAEWLARAAPPPRADVAADISEDDAWAAHAETLLARVETVLASTRFASQAPLAIEAIRQKIPDWPMRVLVLDQDQLVGGTAHETLPIHERFAARDMTGDLSRLLIRTCLGHEAVAKLQAPAARLHAAVEDAAVILAGEDVQALKELRESFAKPVANIEKAVFSLPSSPEWAGAFGLLGESIYAARAAVLYHLISRTIHVSRAHN
jgi:hypothetical protein